MRIALVVASWVGHPPQILRGLCESIRRHSAGAEYDVFLSVNGPDFSPPAELTSFFSRIFIRENMGYNLGAWDHAWRQLRGYDRFLFLQDECFVKRHGWLSDFIRCFDSVPRCGLVGEHLIKDWNRPWDELIEPRDRDTRDPHAIEQAARARFYRQTLLAWGVPPGPTARHLTTVVQFTSRHILEEVNGYEQGRTYREAIAAEIGFSRKIESRGYALAQIGRRRHSRIGHPQWDRPNFFGRLKRSVLKRLP